MVNQSVSMENVLSHNLDVKRANSKVKSSGNSSNFFDILSGSQRVDSSSEFRPVDNMKTHDIGSDFNANDGFDNYNNYDKESYAIDNFVRQKDSHSNERSVVERKVTSEYDRKRDISKLNGRKKFDVVRAKDKRVQLAEKLEKLEEELQKLSSKKESDKLQEKDLNKLQEKDLNKLQEKDLNKLQEKDSDKLQEKDLNKLKSLLSSLLQLLNVKLDEKQTSSGDNGEMVSLKKGLQKLLKLVDKKDGKVKVGSLFESLQKGDDLQGLLDRVKFMLKGQDNQSGKKSVEKLGDKPSLMNKLSDSKIVEEQSMAKIDVVNQGQNDFRKLANKPVFRNGQLKNGTNKLTTNSSSETQAVNLNTQKVESSSNLSGGAEQFMSFDDKASEMKGLQAFKQKTGVKNPKKVFNQIVEHAKVTMKSGMKEMKIQLNPKILGKVGIKLSLKDGQMTARLDVANSALRSLLKDNLSVLESQLRDSGINLVSLDISSHGGNQSNFSELMNRDNQQKKGNGMNAGTGVGKAEETVADLAVKKQEVEVGKVDLVA